MSVRHKAKCKSTICDKTIFVQYEYCRDCRRRIDVGIDPNSERKHGARGNRNPNWKGGISKYKDRYQMRKARKQRLQETEGRCEDCLKVISPTNKLQIHHIDRDKENHSPNNLRLLCQLCHTEDHKKDGTWGHG